MTAKSKTGIWTSVAFVLGLLCAAVAAGILPPLNRIATADDIARLDERVDDADRRQAEVMGQLKEIKCLLGKCE